MSSPDITYGLSESAWEGFPHLIFSTIEREGVQVACEVGGGANPTLPFEYVCEKGIEYVILDASTEELAKAPLVYTKVVRDIQEPDPRAEGRYDLVFSKMLAEHLRDGEAFHRNVWDLLRPGGLAIHFFPTLFAPPFFVNAMLPERLAEWLLHVVQAGRHRSGRLGKFPAFYSWCRGPSEYQIRRLTGLGYRVERYVGFFGHGGYYMKILPVLRIHGAFAKWLVAHPVPLVTSFAWVVLRKP